MSNNIEELRSQNALMKQALLFYGNKENYIEHKKYKEPSLIQADEGSQARFALEQLQAINDINDKMDEDYLKLIENELGKTETPEGIKKLIKEIKNIDENGK